MNRVTLSGYLTKNPEVRYTQSGKAYAKVSIGVTNFFKKNDGGKYESDFFNLIVCDKKAELLGRYTQKGSKIFVEGRLQTSSYEKNGEKKFSIDVVVENFEFASSNGGQKSNSSKDESEEDYDMPF